MSVKKVLFKGPFIYILSNLKVVKYNKNIYDINYLGVENIIIYNYDKFDFRIHNTPKEGMFQIGIYNNIKGYGGWIQRLRPFNFEECMEHYAGYMRCLHGKKKTYLYKSFGFKLYELKDMDEMKNIDRKTEMIINKILMAYGIIKPEPKKSYVQKPKKS